MRTRSRFGSTVRSLGIATLVMLAGGLLGAGGIGATAESTAPRGIVVKYREQGPDAITGCAETLSRRGTAFRSEMHEEDGGLDEIHRQFGMSQHRALMPTPAIADAGTEAGMTGSPAAQLVMRRQRLARRHPASPEMARLAHVYRVNIAADQSVDAAVAALAGDPHVEYAQPDYLYDLDQFEGEASPPTAAPFDDPFLTSSGSWGQPYADLWGAARIGAPEVWPVADGRGAVVAVVDSGLDRFHPDIAANVWVNPGEDLNGDGRATAEDENGIDDDGNGFIDDLTGFDFANSVDADEDGRFDGPEDISDADPFDDNGHGTHVAGTIAAVGGNGLGIVGVAPGARIMALKGFPAEGSASTSVLWRAVLYAAENGADVINTSWSCGRRCPTNPLAEEVLEIVEALGAVVVTSAGNASEDVLFRSPENTTSVITVGSTGAFDALSSFSNRGWLLDLVAPGGGPSGTPGVRVSRRNILSLLSSGARETQLPFAVDEGYLRLSGTSMSAPHVTGAVAVLRAKRPELKPSDVRLLLRLTAEDLGAPGFDAEMGAGLLDLAALIETPMPAVQLRIERPRSGILHSPLDGPLPLQIRAAGDDLASVEVAVGQGLTPFTFAPLFDLDLSQVDEVKRVQWDTTEVPDGPHVLRIRGRLLDGRIVDEFVVVAIERNAPVALSALTLDAGRPAIDQGRVYWHRDELQDGSPAQQVHDLHSQRFPSNAWLERGFEPTPRKIVAREGDQRNLAADGDTLAWVIRRDGMNRIEYCQAPSRGIPCTPREVTEAPGAMTGPFLEEGWLVWMRNDAGTNRIEGCRTNSADGICRPAPLLVDDLFPESAAEPRVDWRLQSFDGETLLLGRAGGVARCRLGADDGEGCQPEPIVFANVGEVPIEPVHSGDLMAYSLVRTELVWPPGCPTGIFTAECLPDPELLVGYNACVLQGEPATCASIPLGDRVPVDQAQGLAITERRIVWSMGSATESAAIRFCEFDRERGLCPSQRLGGSPGFATRPAIEDERIVWEDSREGAVGIFGFALPGLPASRRVSVVAGKPFSFSVWARNGMSPSVDFELEGISGVSVSEASARIEDLERKPRAVTVARVRGVMPYGQTGVSRWILRARGEGGLSSTQTIEIEVRE